MDTLDILITIACFLLLFLLFLQPLSQDKLAGFLSGSTDVASSYQKVKELGSAKIILNLTIFLFFIILILLVVARVT